MKTLQHFLLTKRLSGVIFHVPICESSLASTPSAFTHLSSTRSTLPTILGVISRSAKLLSRLWETATTQPILFILASLGTLVVARAIFELTIFVLIWFLVL